MQRDLPKGQKQEETSKCSPPRALQYQRWRSRRRAEVPLPPSRSLAATERCRCRFRAASQWPRLCATV
jgi:hypothetical protein